MKKSVKILIVVLCLIIVGLVTFIVVDKVINTKKEDSINNKSNNAIVAENNNNEIESNNTTSTNDIKNEEKTTNSSGTQSNANTNKVEVANKAIREALKDEKWITENIISEDASAYEGIYGSNWYDTVSKSLVFAKLSSEENTPLYIVHEPTSICNAGFYLVLYKNEKVISEMVPCLEYGFCEFDLNNRVVRAARDNDGITYYRKIENGEFIDIAEISVEDVIVDDGNGNITNIIDRTEYKINNEIVSKEEFSAFENKYNFVSIETKLTDENIDKYVK